MPRRKFGFLGIRYRWLGEQNCAIMGMTSSGKDKGSKPALMDRRIYSGSTVPMYAFTKGNDASRIINLVARRSLSRRGSCRGSSKARIVESEVMDLEEHFCRMGETKHLNPFLCLFNQIA